MSNPLSKATILEISDAGKPSIRLLFASYPDMYAAADQLKRLAKLPDLAGQENSFKEGDTVALTDKYFAHTASNRDTMPESGWTIQILPAPQVYVLQHPTGKKLALTSGEFEHAKQLAQKADGG